ncbi:MAG TPA: hypothetical protein VMD78_15190 [Candidatus Baltobacteraceae bacterium]|nr:hypothetical protein [Candidatus Baltobacteraceae bacterium]
MNDRQKKAFDFASDLTKQLITLSTSIVTVTLLFSNSLTGPRMLAVFAWAAFLVSTLCGLWALMGLTGTLAPADDPNLPDGTNVVIGKNTRIPSALQVFAFGFATVLTLAYVFLAFSGPASQASAASPEELPPGAWRFAVSGDSRNCGDVVMPAIAQSVLQQKPEFYWHLGDFRMGYGVDDDMNELYGGTLSVADYQKNAWGDFVKNQVKPFGKLPVFLGIGNHELYLRGQGDANEAASHEAFVDYFHSWLDSPELRKQRLADDRSATSPMAYYHWKKSPVDFVYLDNSMDAGFEKAQLDWLENVVLASDRSDRDVQSVVVGMHRALPNSWACGHSMNGDGDTPADVNQRSLESGRQAYKDLLDFHKDTGKHVYLLASHSHFLMSDIFSTAYWKNASQPDRGVLEGWVIGTAGAVRYRLPECPKGADPSTCTPLPKDILAASYVSGYLLGTVHPDGKVEFHFEQVTENDVPKEVRDKYGKKFIDFCFFANRDNGEHTPVASCNDQ